MARHDSNIAFRTYNTNSSGIGTRLENKCLFVKKVIACIACVLTESIYISSVVLLDRHKDNIQGIDGIFFLRSSQSDCGAVPRIFAPP